MPVITQRMSQSQELFLQDLPLFDGLSQQEIFDISRDLIKRRFRRGEYLFREGDPGEVLYVLKSGQVRIYLHGEGTGTETSMMIFGQPGDIIGELAIVDGLPRSASGVAQKETNVLIINRTTFQRHMQRIPQLAMNFMQLLTSKIRRTNNQVSSMASMSISSRLARQLLRLAQDHGEVTEDGVRINAKLSQTDLASFIGASRESTNKALSQFSKEGLIHKIDGRLVIQDPDLLREKIASG